MRKYVRGTCIYNFLRIAVILLELLDSRPVVVLDANDLFLALAVQVLAEKSGSELFRILGN